MTALSAARIVPHKELGGARAFLAANSQTFYNGALCMLDSSGLLRPAGALAANRGCVGICELEPARTEAAGTPNYLESGTSGDVKITVREGIFKMVGATLGQDDTGKLVWALDDQTVDETAPAASTGQCPIAGVLDEYISASLAYVAVSWKHPQREVYATRSLGTIGLDTITAADVLTTWTPGFAGIVKTLDANVIVAATTASKAATINAEIGTDDVTGGLALTSANMTPIGAIVSQALSGGVYFGPSDTISLEASSVTDFVEGEANFTLHYTQITR